MIADLRAAGEDLLLAHIRGHRHPVVAVTDRTAPVELQLCDSLRDFGARGPDVHRCDETFAHARRFASRAATASA